MRLIRTRLNMSTAYHAETDGQTERMNRTMEEVLRHYVDEQQTNWDELLPLVEFAMNSAVNRSTGFSPFYLNYGREPLTPAAMLHGLDGKTSGAHSNARAEELVQRIADALKAAKEKLAKAQESMCHYANKSRKHLEFKRGDQVRLATKNLKRMEAGVKKLDYPWDGPYLVTEKVGAVSYRLALPQNKKVTDVFHVSLLEPWHTSSAFGDRDAPEQSPYMPKDGRDWYNVDRFLKTRKRGKKLEYLVRWEGYNTKYDTWEPEAALRRDLGAQTFKSLQKDLAGRTKKQPAAQQRK